MDIRVVWIFVQSREQRRHGSCDSRDRADLTKTLETSSNDLLAMVGFLAKAHTWLLCFGGPL
jgi:hypothetical protein